MTLAARQSDLVTVITGLQDIVRSCDSDINGGDPDAVAIQRLKEQAMGALGSFGFSSGEPS